MRELNEHLREQVNLAFYQLLKPAYEKSRPLLPSDTNEREKISAAIIAAHKLLDDMQEAYRELNKSVPKDATEIALRRTNLRNLSRDIADLKKKYSTLGHWWNHREDSQKRIAGNRIHHTLLAHPGEWFTDEQLIDSLRPGMIYLRKNEKGELLYTCLSESSNELIRDQPLNSSDVAEKYQPKLPSRSLLSKIKEALADDPLVYAAVGGSGDDLTQNDIDQLDKAAILRILSARDHVHEFSTVVIRDKFRTTPEPTKPGEDPNSWKAAARELVDDVKTATFNVANRALAEIDNWRDNFALNAAKRIDLSRQLAANPEVNLAMNAENVLYSKDRKPLPTVESEVDFLVELEAQRTRGYQKAQEIFEHGFGESKGASSIPNFLFYKFIRKVTGENLAGTQDIASLMGSTVITSEKRKHIPALVHNVFPNVTIDLIEKHLRGESSDEDLLNALNEASNAIALDQVTALLKRLNGLRSKYTDESISEFNDRILRLMSAIIESYESKYNVRLVCDAKTGEWNIPTPTSPTPISATTHQKTFFDGEPDAFKSDTGKKAAKFLQEKLATSAKERQEVFEIYSQEETGRALQRAFLNLHPDVGKKSKSPDEAKHDKEKDLNKIDRLCRLGMLTRQEQQEQQQELTSPSKTPQEERMRFKALLKNATAYTELVSARATAYATIKQQAMDRIDTAKMPEPDKKRQKAILQLALMSPDALEKNIVSQMAQIKAAMDEETLFGKPRDLAALNASRALIAEAMLEKLDLMQNGRLLGETLSAEILGGYESTQLFALDNTDIKTYTDFIYRHGSDEAVKKLERLFPKQHEAYEEAITRHDNLHTNNLVSESNHKEIENLIGSVAAAAKIDQAYRLYIRSLPEDKKPGTALEERTTFNNFLASENGKWEKLYNDVNQTLGTTEKHLFPAELIAEAEAKVIAKVNEIHHPIKLIRCLTESMDEQLKSLSETHETSLLKIAERKQSLDAAISLAISTPDIPPEPKPQSFVSRILSKSFVFVSRILSKSFDKKPNKDEVTPTGTQTKNTITGAQRSPEDEKTVIQSRLNAAEIRKASLEREERSLLNKIFSFFTREDSSIASKIALVNKEIQELEKALVDITEREKLLAQEVSALAKYENASKKIQLMSEEQLKALKENTIAGMNTSTISIDDLSTVRKFVTDHAHNDQKQDFLKAIDYKQLFISQVGEHAPVKSLQETFAKIKEYASEGENTALFKIMLEYANGDFNPKEHREESQWEEMYKKDVEQQQRKLEIEKKDAQLSILNINTEIEDKESRIRTLKGWLKELTNPEKLSEDAIKYECNNLSKKIAALKNDLTKEKEELDKIEAEIKNPYYAPFAAERWMEQFFQPLPINTQQINSLDDYVKEKIISLAKEHFSKKSPASEELSAFIKKISSLCETIFNPDLMLNAVYNRFNHTNNDNMRLIELLPTLLKYHSVESQKEFFEKYLGDFLFEQLANGKPFHSHAIEYLQEIIKLGEPGVAKEALYEILLTHLRRNETVKWEKDLANFIENNYPNSDLAKEYCMMRIRELCWAPIDTLDEAKKSLQELNGISPTHDYLYLSKMMDRFIRSELTNAQHDPDKWFAPPSYVSEMVVRHFSSPEKLAMMHCAWLDRVVTTMSNPDPETGKTYEEFSNGEKIILAIIEKQNTPEALDGKFDGAHEALESKVDPAFDPIIAEAYFQEGHDAAMTDQRKMAFFLGRDQEWAKYFREHVDYAKFLILESKTAGPISSTDSVNDIRAVTAESEQAIKLANSAFLSALDQMLPSAPKPTAALETQKEAVATIVERRMGEADLIALAKAYLGLSGTAIANEDSLHHDATLSISSLITQALEAMNRWLLLPDNERTEERRQQYEAAIQRVQEKINNLSEQLQMHTDISKEKTHVVVSGAAAAYAYTALKERKEEAETKITLTKEQLEHQKQILETLKENMSKLNIKATSSDMQDEEMKEVKPQASDASSAVTDKGYSYSKDPQAYFDIYLDFAQKTAKKFISDRLMEMAMADAKTPDDIIRNIKAIDELMIKPITQIDERHVLPIVESFKLSTENTEELKTLMLTMAEKGNISAVEEERITELFQGERPLVFSRYDIACKQAAELRADMQAMQKYLTAQAASDILFLDGEKLDVGNIPSTRELLKDMATVEKHLKEMLHTEPTPTPKFSDTTVSILKSAVLDRIQHIDPQNLDESSLTFLCQAARLEMDSIIPKGSVDAKSLIAGLNEQISAGNDMSALISLSQNFILDHLLQNSDNNKKTITDKENIFDIIQAEPMQSLILLATFYSTHPEKKDSLKKEYEAVKNAYRDLIDLTTNKTLDLLMDCQKKLAEGILVEPGKLHQLTGMVALSENKQMTEYFKAIEISAAFVAQLMEILSDEKTLKSPKKIAKALETSQAEKASAIDPLGALKLAAEARALNSKTENIQDLTFLTNAAQLAKDLKDDGFTKKIIPLCIDKLLDALTKCYSDLNEGRAIRGGTLDRLSALASAIGTPEIKQDFALFEKTAALVTNVLTCLQKNEPLPLTDILKLVAEQDPNNPKAEANVMVATLKSAIHAKLLNISGDSKENTQLMQYALQLTVIFQDKDFTKEVLNICTGKQQTAKLSPENVMLQKQLAQSVATVDDPALKAKITALCTQTFNKSLANYPFGVQSLLPAVDTETLINIVPKNKNVNPRKIIEELLNRAKELHKDEKNPTRHAEIDKIAKAIEKHGNENEKAEMQKHSPAKADADKKTLDAMKKGGPSFFAGLVDSKKPSTPTTHKEEKDQEMFRLAPRKS